MFDLGLLVVFTQDIDYNIPITTISAKNEAGVGKMEGYILCVKKRLKQS